MENKEYKIGIVGMGYVGLPLAIAFSEHYTVFGYDIDDLRISNLQNGIDTNFDIDFDIDSNLKLTNHIESLKNCNIYIITVPTPVDQNNNPDLSFLKSATKEVGLYLKQNDIVIYESTVYPGVTEEVCVPILENESSLIFNIDFHCGYSPERISPGEKKYNLKDIVKITSGSNDQIAEEIDFLYNKIIDAGTYKAPSIKVAEAAKVVENTQRDINIALMNELAMMFDKFSLDTNEILNAASTKWNFLKFKPGLVGGHCIGVDPYYLLHKSEKLGYRATLLESSRRINNSVSKFIAEKVFSKMLGKNKDLSDVSILIFGYTFKENCSDVRNTKVKDIIDILESKKCNVSVFDPFINKDQCNNFVTDPFKLNEKYDVIIVAVAHNEFLKYSAEDFNVLSKEKLVLLDIKGIYSGSHWKL
tara:strand:+ start:347 stop:1597 length:1251 start_codon:yes stop_codon:yes gene_type:complete